jgi:F-type H+-transporting ATPase subunit b
MAQPNAPTPTTHPGTTEPAGHSQMPQLDLSTYVPQLFWLFVTFFVLYVLMKRLAVPQVGRAIEARRQRLDSDLGRAGELKAEAESVLAAYQKTLAGARAKAQARLRETTERMAAEAAERQRQLALTLAQQIAAAEHSIAAAKDEALAEIRGIAVDVGRSVVEKLTGSAPDAAKMAAAVDAAVRPLLPGDRALAGRAG